YSDIDWESAPDDVNYGVLYEKRYPVLRKAAARFVDNIPEDYAEFCTKNEFWLDDYAMFMAFKDSSGGASWHNWEEGIRNRNPQAMEKKKEELAGEIEFWKILQYLFFRQWNDLRAYVNARGIKFIGDLPIYVSLDGVDVWSQPQLFQLDENRYPKEVAGCPPDGFSADGQLWGNPLYDWDYMEKDGFSWWKERIEYLLNVYDVLRIDHFRGFESYYAIPYGDTTAQNGYWKKGPGMKLFDAIEKEIGRQPIIAEDLGYLTDDVKQMLAESGFPGMKVLEFAFDSRDANSVEYLPYKYTANSVAYIGTHDNDTACGWMNTAPQDDIRNAVEYLNLNKTEGYNWGLMRALWTTASDTTVVQFQDLLGLGSESRMNTPSSVGKNWRWRTLPNTYNKELAQKLYHKMELYGRLGK
ncbi:MAG: 4-alpha-glucanotransferase, partial [Oscillospiraceae bacterium]|nr:4-alpha-glucanotransferase [Oscillospiraceae bacterium]